MAGYSNGTPPSGITQDEIYTIYKDQCDAMINWQVLQTGMPATMPAGAYRVANPDQARFNINGGGNAANPGTINITNGSTQVVGTGTQFTKYSLKSIVEAIGDPVYNEPDKAFILSIQSDTALTLDKPYKGPTRTGAQFKVGGGTFSEGTGYGLVNFAYRSRGTATTNPIYHSQAKAIADGLILHYKYYFNERGLSHWRINPDGTISGTDGRNGATDGDFDVAFGMLKMHQFHGSAGTINYLAEATSLINKIDLHEFYSSTHANLALRDVMINGDGWDSSMSGSPDRYMMDYFRAGYCDLFGAVTGNTARWAAIKAKQYEKLNYFYTTFNTGLIPDESKRDGTTLGFAYKFGFNSIRIPWDWVLDYMWNGASTNALALNQSKRLADWSRTKFLTPAAHKAEHNLDGTTTGNYASPGFLACYMAAGLVHTDSAQWAGDCIKWLRDNKVLQSYFGGWLATNALLVATGEMQPYVAPVTGVAPAAPTLQTLSSNADGSVITLDWSDVAGVTGYKIYDVTQPGALEVAYLQVPPGISTSTLPSAPGTDYYFKVSALNDYGESPLSNTLYIKTNTSPTKPPFLRLPGGAPHPFVFLEWDRPLGLDPLVHPGYKVYRSVTTDGAYTVLHVGHVSSESYVDQTAAPSSTFYYKVTATNDVGESAFSNIVSITTPPANTTPPNILTLSGI